MIENTITFRVRYGETDQMGYVYYGNYPSYFEVGRVEWMRNLGISYKGMEENGVILPVHSLSIKYHKPAKYDDLLTLTTRLTSSPTVKINFEYEIYNEQKELITTADTTLVFIDKLKNRPIKVPEIILEKLKESENPV